MNRAFKRTNSVYRGGQQAFPAAKDPRFGPLIGPLASRCYSQANLKPDMKLLAHIRKETQASISKAKEALLRTANDPEKALAWLEEDMIKSGAKKIEKLGDREAKEGLIGVFVSPQNSNVTMVQLSCETDFVSRNSYFQKYLLELGQLLSTQLQSSINVREPQGRPFSYFDGLIDAKVAKDQTEKFSSLVGKLGENIQVKRLANERFDSRHEIVAVYAHSDATVPRGLGKVASYIALGAELQGLPARTAKELQMLVQRLAQHVTGIPNDSNTVEELLKQKFLFDGELTVADLIRQFQETRQLEDVPKIVRFQRWVL